MNQTFKADIAIFGGGIAGLWILNRLCQKGYNCVLIENQSLGGMQTLACQGMIHGGQKFALPGSAQSKQQSLAGSIAKMPAIWHDCLKGTGEIDLSKARVLSENQFMWSPGGITGSATAFLASKLMNARVTLVKNSDQWPDVFYENRQIKGRLYRMDEEVVSVKSVVNALNARFTDTIYRADINEIVVKNNNVEYIDLVDGQNRIKLSASGFVFTAGVGNEKVAEAIGLTGRVTQRRPLKQVMVRNVPYALYAHCISMNPKPRVTITAHPEENNTYVWYLGGLVAEQGVEKNR
jgi:glycerol-3-phosphate dehydrogenase